MSEQSPYYGMQVFNPETANIRYHLLLSDNATLYRKFSRRDVRQKPEYNIHDWLNHISNLKSIVPFFHSSYAART